MHDRFKYSQDQLEAFMCNHGNKFTQELLPAFEKHLDEEQKTLMASAATPMNSGSGASKAAKAAKRKSLAVPSALGAALGLSVAPAAASVAAAAEETAAKRPREEDDGGGAAAASAATGGETAVEEASAQGATPLAVEVLGDPKLWMGGPSGTYLWMDEALEDRAAERNARLLRWQRGLVEAMRSRHPDLEEVVIGAVGAATQAEVVLCGRIVCESLEGKLNERSLLLEAPRADGDGLPPARIRLNTAGCKSIVAFPGQLVCVLGRAGTAGSVFHARDLVSGLPTASPSAVPPSAPAGDDSDLHMFVMAGPFCLRDGLDYSPLERAFELAAAARPQAIVLLGPLLDASNQRVSSGEPGPAGDEAEGIETLEDIYTEVIIPLLQRSVASLRRRCAHTQVFVVPSLEDVLCFHPLPQPPLDAMLRPTLGDQAVEQLRGVRFLPNPAHLRLGGVTVSLTSADALSPLLRSGLVLRPEERRLEAGLRALLQQRCLFPAAPRDPPQVAERRAAALDFPGGQPPELCIFPSQVGSPCATHIDGSAFVNPGSVCRPAALGSFAEIRVASSRRVGAEGTAKLLQDVLRVDIHKLS